MMEYEEEIEKPFYKKTWFIIVAIIVVLIIIGTAFDTEEKEDEVGAEPEKETTNNETGAEPKEVEEVTEAEEVEELEEIVYVATRIIDGDTFELNTGDKVRLICIDTPESGEEYYNEASVYLEELILNKEIILVKDISDTDMYGRLLRYVYIEDVFINNELIKKGFAKVYRYPPDTELCNELEGTETIAKNNNLGIWKEETTIIKTEIIIEQNSTTNITNEYVCDSNYYNCGDFRTHNKAQEVYEICGGPATDIHKLDRDNNGIACESLP